MFNQNLVKIEDKTLKSTGQPIVTIESPYNGEFVAELKRNIPSAKWLSGARLWSVAPDCREQAESIAAKYFPAAETLQKVRIAWSLHRDSPQIDGAALASVSRDWWGWKKDCAIEFKVIENELESGGSRNNPGLYGKLIIETSIRPDAVISPTPKSVEVIEEGERPNPLADFSTEDLLAELARREVQA